MIKIFVDGGHGGPDPGAIGKHSKEKDNVLKVAKRLKTLLESHGHTVRLSRSTDVFLTLSERAKLANDWGADYFVSLHDNAATSSATGFETFIHNGPVSSLQNAIHDAILKGIGIRDRGKKRANFAVLRETKMPAVLIEYAFISNTNDERILIDEVEKLAQLTAKGIVNYAGGVKPSIALSKKEDDELKFSSPSLKAEVELTLKSKARREIIVNAAVKAGAHPSWLDKLENKTITDADILALATKQLVDTHR